MTIMGFVITRWDAFLDWLYWDSRRDLEDLREILLDCVPMWFRYRWPMKRFFWQPEQVDAIHEEAERIREQMGWDGE